MLSARSKAFRLAFVRSIAHKIFLIVVTSRSPPSLSPALSSVGAPWRRRLDPERPWGGVTGREGVGQNVGNLGLRETGIPRAVVPRACRISFVRIRRTHHVCPSSQSHRTAACELSPTDPAR